MKAVASLKPSPMHIRCLIEMKKGNIIEESKYIANDFAT